MKQVKNFIYRHKTLILGICFFIPLICGFIGLMLLHEGSPVDCLYKSVQLYMMEYNIQAKSINLFVEIARWTAPLAAGAIIISFLLSLMNKAMIIIRVKDPTVVVLHGDSKNKTLLRENFGNIMIESDEPEAFKAKTHVLMFDDDTNMYSFLKEHSSRLMGDSHSKVILCSDDIRRGSYDNNQFIICNTAENCARDYWLSYPVRNKSERIVIFGFGNYGQILLDQAILKNVVSLESNIEYHIIGEYGEYLGKHEYLHKAIHVKIHDKNGDVKDYKGYEEICENNDTVHFYDAPWYDILSVDKEFDRIIICFDDDTINIRTLGELIKYYSFSNYYVRFPDDKIMTTLWNLKDNSIITFGKESELFSPEVVLKEELLLQAKKINARYFSQYKCKEHCKHKEAAKSQNELLAKCADCPHHMEDWDNLSSFLRYSNVAQADHIQEKVWLIMERTINRNGSGAGEEVCVDMDAPGINEEIYNAYMNLDKSEKEILWKIEHLRWDRYHFLNNWDYAEKRDNPKRKHHLLVPFEQLAYEELRKDEDAYLALREVLG